MRFLTVDTFFYEKANFFQCRWKKTANRQKSESFTLEFANFGINEAKKIKVELGYLKQRVYIFFKNSPPPFLM